ncbi:WXG100 family type VII secretion target [Pseudonocardia thermophila]|uniref:ESAT-6-like protein n=1 Tax=Pseudonocardia thermophila TaxID=1848 RepID=A0A1M6X4G4_PSETH|nr:WXG100 family type VII secretion target [Pseudonocardia thermophila]SHL00818.1 WXG100 family type VII secretion target [Pseudonocardia thermophila]
MSTIKVDYAGLAAASADIRRTAEAIDAQLADLQTFLAPLVAAWTGAAAEAYQEKQRIWNTAQADQQAVLAHMAKLPLVALERYQAVESRVSQTFRA